MQSVILRFGACSLLSALLLSAACASAAPSESPPPGGFGDSSGVSTSQYGDGAGKSVDGVPAAPASDALESRAGGGAPAQAPEAADDRMVVYTTQISLDVESVQGSVTAVMGLAEGLGGYVSQNTLRVQGDQDFATMVIRVPASAYNQAMEQLRKLGVKVTAENGSTRDVTEQFADLGAQVRNLEASESQLQALMIRAETVDEILKVQNQLSQVRGQIERLKGRINVLQRTSDMATITISLTPVIPGKPESPKGWDPLRTIQESWDASLQGLVQVVDAGLRVTVSSWWAILLGLMGWAGFSAWRRGRPRVAGPLPGNAPS